jgi:hypothetical protein
VSKYLGRVKYQVMAKRSNVRWIIGSDKVCDKVCAADAFAYHAPVVLCDGRAIRAHFEGCLVVARSVGHKLGLGFLSTVLFRKQ